MSDTQAPTQQTVVTYSGECKACNTDVQRSKYAEANKSVKGLYVRCECGQINRCFQ